MLLNGGTSYGLLLGLGARYLKEPICMGSIILDDAIDTRYRFEIYDINEKVRGTDAVYAFASTAPNGFHINYIGKAGYLNERLSSHERMRDALRIGANRLLIHIPKAIDRIGHEEAEIRLIRRYSPPLNKQHVSPKNLASQIIGLGMEH